MTARPMAAFVRRAEKAGCTVRITRGGHYAMRTPSGLTVFCPSTPSDHRALLNTRALLRRAGVRI